MSYQFTTAITEKEHNDFIKTSPYCNLLQSAQWAKVKDNWGSLLAGVRDDGGVLVASSLVLIKQLPLHFTMFYIPRGPILDYLNADLVTFYFQGLKKVAKKHHCLFMKFDPEIHRRDHFLEDEGTPVYDHIEQIMRHIEQSGGIHQGYTTYIEETIQPRYQANVYKCDDFIEQLPRHTRRLIKDALKRNVQVVKADSSELQGFCDVVALTEERKNVNLRNSEYFQQLMDIYQEDAYLFLAKMDIPQVLANFKKQYEDNEKELQQLKEGAPKKLRRLQDIKQSLEKDIKEFEEYQKLYQKETVIAGILSIKFGRTMEMLYAGMDDHFKKFMPQYYLYTENMKYAFAHGCEFANMGGIEGDFQDGLTKFKSNFHPMINELIGEFDYPVNKVFYHASKLAYRLRKRKHQG